MHKIQDICNNALTYILLETTTLEECNYGGTERYVVVGSIMSGIIVGLFLAYIFFVLLVVWLQTENLNNMFNQE